ncbi:hypothetical protein HO173_013223 [Letharia columbiana]|uniref:WD40 repeat-like protein n=1 Tax=Letharia columbiana TaxID=112416 RepID=A0A8H6FCM8_9LECA|nr:uncharacterized protein HO173_013223 [Letharia columbiana]KAF6223176.1 hypothetical protein HO173_013223 [Letharia columbiana]
MPLSNSHKPVQRPITPVLDEMIDDFEGLDSDEPMEKDEVEMKLEKMVFGDKAGFHEGLKSHRDASTDLRDLVDGDRQQAQDGLGEGNLEGLDDTDLFFLDSTPSVMHVPDLLPQSNSDQDTTSSDGGNAAAWVDSDDERIVVSLASNPRLRKLRTTEFEDLVNGKEYSKRLRRQFERLYPVPDWANPTVAEQVASRKRNKLSIASESSEANASADDMSVGSDDLSTHPLAKLLQDTDGLIQLIPTSSNIRKKLRPEVIDIHRTRDVGTVQPSAITNLDFHPVHSLLLSSGPSSMLFLHHVSPHLPNPNPVLTTLHLSSTPLTTSLFHPPAGNKIFFSGRRRYFHTWDLDTGKVEKVSRVIGHGEVQRSMERFKLSPCGRWIGFVGSGRKRGGTINVLDASSCQWVAEVRVEGKGGVADFDWWGDGEGLVVVGKGGEVVEWDGRERRAVARWIDEGAIGTTVVALGGHGGGSKALGNDRWVAVGSSSGIVNIYDRRKWSAESVPARPNPVRAFDQLTTPTSHLEFSQDGQVLCMASRWKRDALRLIHLPSCTVYRNWPTSSTPLGRITAVAWSPTADMLAVANEQGKIRLWEIRS